MTKDGGGGGEGKDQQIVSLKEEIIKLRMTINTHNAFRTNFSTENKTLKTQKKTLETELSKLKNDQQQKITEAEQRAEASIRVKQEEFEQAQTALQEQIDAKQEELKENQDNLAANGIQISELEAQNRDLTARVTELEKQLVQNINERQSSNIFTSLVQEKQQLSDQVQALKNTKDKLGEIFKGQLEQIKTLNEEIAAIKIGRTLRSNNITKFQGALKKLESQLSAAAEREAAFTQEKELLTKLIAQQEDKMGNITRQVRNLQNAKNTNLGQIAAKDKKLKSSKEELQKQSKEVEALQQQLEEQRLAAASEKTELTQQLEALKKQAAEREAGLQTQLDQKGREAAEREAVLQTQLEEQEREAQEAKEASQRDNAELQEDLKELQSQLDQSGALSEEQKSQITAQLEEIQELQTGNSSLQAANQQQREQFQIQQDALESSIARLDEEKQGIESALVKSEHLLNQKGVELKEAQDAAREKEEEITRLGDQNTELQSQIRKAQQQITAAEQKAGADQKQNTELSANLQRLQDQLTENQRQLKAANSEKAQQEDVVRRLSDDLKASESQNQGLISVKAELGAAKAALEQEHIKNAGLVERVSSLEQQVDEKTRELAALQEEVVAQQGEVSRLQQSNIDLSLQLSDSKGKLDVKDLEIKQLIDAQAQASKEAAEARRGLEELKGQYDILQEAKSELAEANTGLEAQIKALEVQNEAARQTAEVEQDAAVANVRARMTQTLSEQREEFQRETDQAVREVTDEYKAKLRFQEELIRKAQEGLEESQKEAAQQNAEIRAEMQRFFLEQTTQNTKNTEALKKQIAEMQTAHAAETAKIRKDNQQLQQQIMDTNLAVAKETTKQVRMQTNAAIEQKTLDNQIRREELEAKKTEQEQQRQDEAKREAKAEAKTKDARDLVKIQEFKTSVETVGKKFTEALEKFQDLKNLSREQLIKLADPKSYDLSSKKANFGEILGSETLRNIEGYIRGEQGTLEYIGVKFPNTDPSDLSQENRQEYDAVFQKLERDRGIVKEISETLTQDKLPTQAKTELYLQGINIDRNPEEFLKTLAKNETRLTNIPEAVKPQLKTEITSAIASLSNISKQKNNIVKILDRLELGGLVNFAAENTRLFLKNDNNSLNAFAEEICKSAKASNNVAALKKIMLKIKDPDDLEDFIGKIPDEQKQEIVESDKSGRLIKQLFSRKSMTVDTIKGLTDLHDLVEAYKDEEKTNERLSKKADQNEDFAEKLNAAGFDYKPEIKQSVDIAKDVPLRQGERTVEPKKQGFFDWIRSLFFGSNTEIQQQHSEYEEYAPSREQQQSNGLTYRNDHVNREMQRRGNNNIYTGR